MEVLGVRLVFIRGNFLSLVLFVFIEFGRWGCVEERWVGECGLLRKVVENKKDEGIWEVRVE